jgi:hypothetical protein
MRIYIYKMWMRSADVDLKLGSFFNNKIQDDQINNNMNFHLILLYFRFLQGLALSNSKISSLCAVIKLSWIFKTSKMLRICDTVKTRIRPTGS